MSTPKKNKKKMDIKNPKSFIPKNFNLNKFKVNPFNAIDGVKNQIGSFYNDLKKKE